MPLNRWKDGRAAYGKDVLAAFVKALHSRMFDVSWRSRGRRDWVWMNQ